MLENFDEDVEDLEVELCEDLMISSAALDNIVHDYVGDFDAPACVAQIKIQQKRFMIEFLNLAVEENDEILKSELNRCIQIMKVDVAETFECIMNHLM